MPGALASWGWEGTAEAAGVVLVQEELVLSGSLSLLRSHGRRVVGGFAGGRPGGIPPGMVRSSPRLGFGAGLPSTVTTVNSAGRNWLQQSWELRGSRCCALGFLLRFVKSGVLVLPLLWVCVWGFVNTKPESFLLLYS